jgi:hypothetical protein
MYVCVCVCARVSVRACLYMWSMYACMYAKTTLRSRYVCMYVCLHSWFDEVSRGMKTILKSRYVCMCVCLHSWFDEVSLWHENDIEEQVCMCISHVCACVFIHGL